MSATTAAATTSTTDAGTDANTPEHQKNDKRYTDLMKTVTALGGDASLGRDSLPKLAYAVVKAAADGVIDADFKDKAGKTTAEIVYDRYAAAESKKAVHEHSVGGRKAQVSKLKQLIDFGALATIDAVEVLQAAFDAREAMKSDDEKVKSSYPYFVDVARAQLKSPDKALTKKTLEGLAVKEAPAPKELDAILKQIEDLLEGVITGENRHKVKDQSDLIEAAHTAVKERRQAMATALATMKLRQEAAKLGIQLA